MDKNRFDGFTRQLAKRENRRQAIKTLFAGGAGTAAAMIVGKESEAAKPGSTSDCCPADHPKLCGLTCTNVATDPQHCGSCDNQCTSGQTCVSGTCTPAVTRCKKTRDCPSGQTCTNGICTGTTPQCTSAADCPAGNECKNPVCQSGTCGYTFVSSGTVTSAQTANDCQKKVCDGSGNIISVPDPTDLPIAQGECYTPICNAGSPQQQPKGVGTHCSGGTCDGNGHCVAECASANDCPATGNECVTRTCTNGVCGTSFVADGVAVTAQTAGDCKKTVCDGAGGTKVVNDDTDVPTAPNDCVSSVCTAGAPSNQPKAPNTSCSGGICDGNGACVQCISAANCPAGNECKQAVCQNGTCGFSFVSLGIPCATGFCDGNGACVECINDNYCPTNGQDCVTSTCQNGICTPGSAPAGTPCSHGVCDGYNTCIGCVTPVDCAGGVLPHATVTCTSGVCGYYCDAGWGDCNPGPDGCDTYLLNDPQHCGGCNQVCPTLPNAVVICANGACGLAACNSGYLDCNGILADGCEVNASNDFHNCGMCGKVCGANQSCVNGACQ